MGNFKYREIYKYVSALCGSGKTYAICKEINESNENFIVVQTKLELINQTLEQIPGCRAITTNSVDDFRVIDEVVDFLKEPTSRVLIISDKTFFKICPTLLKRWKIYFDDVTNFHTYKEINEDSKNIKKAVYCEVFQDHKKCDDNDKYLTAKKKEVEGDILKDVSNKFDIVDENDSFVMNNDYFKNDDKMQLSITAWKDLKKYAGLDITFIGANFENSLIYKGHKDMFKRIELPGLRVRTTPVEDRMKVYYFSEKIRLSKTWKSNNQDKLRMIYDYLIKVLEGRIYCWTNNNSDTLKLNPDFRISPDARGINKYEHIDTFVWLACMRPCDAEAKQCELFLGFNSIDIHQAREYESLYQFVQRGCIRNYESSQIQEIYVFDKQQALSLTENIEYIDLGIDSDIVEKPNGRPDRSKNKYKKHSLSNTKNKRLNRFFKKTDVNLTTFKDFLCEKTNEDLSNEDKEVMWAKFYKKTDCKSNSNPPQFLKS